VEVNIYSSGGLAVKRITSNDEIPGSSPGRSFVFGNVFIIESTPPFQRDFLWRREDTRLSIGGINLPLRRQNMPSNVVALEHPLDRKRQQKSRLRLC
jgi:hypothetical protein